MLQRLKFGAAPALALGAMMLAAAPAAAAALSAQSVSASSNAASQRLNVSIVLKNTSKNTIQAFISTPPTATDDAGNSYTSTSLSGQEVGGLAVCSSASYCLTDDKAKTENAATQLDAGDMVTLTIAFCCKNSGKAAGAKASAGIIVQVRDVIDAKTFSPWRTVSVGLPDIPVTTSDK